MPFRLQIVWACIGPRGKYKKRPAIVLSDVVIPNPATRIVVAVCSTDFDEDDLKPNELLIPSDTASQLLTQLTDPTVVVWDWLEDISVSEVEEYGGRLPPDTALELFKKLKNKYKTTDPIGMPLGNHVPRQIK